MKKESTLYKLNAIFDAALTEIQQKALLLLDNHMKEAHSLVLTREELLAVYREISLGATEFYLATDGTSRRLYFDLSKCEGKTYMIIVVKNKDTGEI
jgi:hypothetical protein